MLKIHNQRHLGNARISFADLNDNKIVDVPGDILQENHYYPFGLNMNYAWMNNNGLSDQKYLYNGKELNDDFGLNLSDYGARWYDAAIGRWWSVDPMAEGTVNVSPFAYVLNNPMVMIDPTGMFGVTYGKDGHRSASEWGAAKHEEFNNSTERKQNANRYKEIVSELKQTRTNIDADAATYDDERVYEASRGNPVIPQDADENLLPGLVDFAKYLKSLGGTGTLSLWIQPHLYKLDKDANPDDIPFALKSAQNDSGLAIKTGMVNAYNK